MKHKSIIFTDQDVAGGEYLGDEFVSCHFPVTLKFTSFKNCKFDNCDFTGCHFDSTAFESCTFPGSKLSYLDFALASLVKCNFDTAVIKNSIFHHYKAGGTNQKIRFDLQNCSFVKSDLSNSVFAHCNLTGVDFGGSNLEHLSFDSCILKKAGLIGCNIEGTRFENCLIDNTSLALDGFIQYGVSKGFRLEQN